MKKILISIFALGAMTLSSCMDSLDTMPIDNNILVADQVYLDYDNYEKVLAKVYAGLAVSGQDGGSDISGIDGGFGQFLRGLFNLQELPTDEAICNWDDKTIKDFQSMSWSSSDEFVTAMYNRVFYQAALCNEYLRQTTPEKLAERGMTAHAAEIEVMRAETRFVRAYAYWVGIDLFGNIPFVDETSPIGTTAATAPKQKTRKEVAQWIESELKAIETTLPVSGNAAYYGRATQGSAWALLARLYLNFEVYTAMPRWSECITYCNKVIGAGFSLAPSYPNMFLADNDKTSKSEFIFTVVIDGLRTQSFGATTFLVNASTGGKMNVDYMGAGAWGGLRTTTGLVDKFPKSVDGRALFFTDGQTLDIPTNSVFKEGYAIQKFRNVTSTGVLGQDRTFCDIDMPILRLADVYLMYAEAVKRGGTGGSEGAALGYLNLIRQRAYGSTAGNIGSYDLNYIIDERARELYWENIRRTDLIRFDMLTTDKYVWQWKGGAVNGKAVNSIYNLYPLAASDVGANPNLKQNPGY